MNEAEFIRAFGPKDFGPAVLRGLLLSPSDRPGAASQRTGTPGGVSLPPPPGRTSTERSCE